MTLAYQIMYRLGFMPWEQDEPISDIAELVDGPNALPPGQALDIGCLHGLNNAQLTRAATNISRAAKPGATLLMFAIAPGAPKPAPVGIDPDDLPNLFPAWKVVASRHRRGDRHARPARQSPPLRTPPRTDNPTARVTSAG